MPPFVDRYFKGGVPETLKPNGQLRFVLDELACIEDTEGVRLDPQIWKSKWLHIYYGRPHILEIEFHPNPDGRVKQVHVADSIRRAAPTAYEQLDGLKDGKLSASDYRRCLREAIDRVQAGAADGNKGWDDQEGYWQNRLSCLFGCDSKPDTRWLSIGREYRVRYRQGSGEQESGTQLRRRALENVEKKHKLGMDKLHELDRSRFPGRRTFGDKVDLLAIAEDGSLVCIEMKHVGRAKDCKHKDLSDACWSVLQAAAYKQLFGEARAAIGDSVISMVRQKIEMGLLPSHAAARLPKNGCFPDVRAVVVVAEPDKDVALRERLRDSWAMICAECPGACTDVYFVDTPQSPSLTRVRLD